MARHRDSNWELDTPPSIPGAQLAVLMDIRDELKALNKLLGCQNFLAIPHTLRSIDRTMVRAERRLAKHIPLRTKK